MIALDIETAAKPGLPKECALDQHRSVITKIAFWSPDYSKCFDGLDPALVDGPYVFHAGKFDIKHLVSAGAPFTSDDLTEDTNLMAVAFSKKVPEEWLEAYDARRVLLNKELGGDVHRKAGKHSLKTLAPYFLGVPAFWEVANHNDSQYALKDAEYTYRLWEFFTEELKKDGTYEFYKEKLIPWTRTLLEAEIRGVGLDLPLMNQLQIESELKYKASEEELHKLWRPAYQHYYHVQREELAIKYGKMIKTAQGKLKDPSPERLKQVEKRYDVLLESAVAKLPFEMNLASNDQLSWILKDYLKLDITTFDGKDESTGKAILKRLAAQGRKDIGTLLDFREHHKLSTAFFPKYQSVQWGGRIHCSFNPDIARTGRLSSSDPNLQQVPRAIRRIFRAGPGRSFIVRDFSGVEPFMLAYVSEAKSLCDLLLEGKNFHNISLQLIAEIDCTDAEAKSVYAAERDLVKENGLSLIYGAGARVLHESSSKRGFNWTLSDCRRKLKRFKEHYYEIYEYKEELDSRLARGEKLKNVFGRPIVCAPDKIYITGLNTYIQGSASDLLQESTRRANAQFKKENLDAIVVLLVHDEVVIDCLDEHTGRVSEIVDEFMTNWEMKTKWGALKMKAEGGVSQTWMK